MIRRVLALLAVVAAVLLTTAVPAGAIPGLPDCATGVNPKTPPTPAMPGQGVPGFFDRTPHNTDGTTVYDQYGYAGLTWNTYDIGCIPDAGAIFDTAMGDGALGVSVTFVSISNALHEAVSHLGFLDKLNPLLTEGTRAVSRAILSPWIGLSLLALGGVLLSRARKQDLPGSVTAVGWALIVLLAATIAIQYPIRASHLADGLTNSSVGLVNSTMLGAPHTSKDPAAARASIVVNDVLYRNWLRGEFGNPDSHTAKVYGRALLDAQAFTWGQAARIAKHPGDAAKITHGKNTAWTHLVGKIKDQDPDAYFHITGHAHNRFGAGGLSMIAAFLVLAFLIAADLIVVVALVLFRLGIILIPAIAPIAVHSRATLRRTLHVMVGGLGNAVLYAFGAGLQLINIRVVLGGSGLPEWVALLLCGVISFVLWRLLRQLWKFTHAFQSGWSPVDEAAKGLTDTRKRATRFVSRFAAAYGGSRAGSEAGVEHAMAEDKPAQPAPASYTRPAATYSSGPAPSGSGPAPGALPAGVPDSPAPDGPSPPHGPPVPGQPGLPAAQPATRPAVDGSEPTIIPAGQDLPSRPVRADAVVEDGKVIHRIWVPGGPGQPDRYENYVQPQRGEDQP